MKADTGIDPIGSLFAFIKKDAIKCIDVHRDHKEEKKHETSIKIPAGKVPHGTTKYTYKLGLDTNAKLMRE